MGRQGIERLLKDDVIKADAVARKEPHKLVECGDLRRTRAGKLLSNCGPFRRACVGIKLCQHPFAVRLGRRFRVDVRCAWRRREP